MRVYSPSQTATWLDCPVKRVLAYQEKWASRRLGKRDLAAILGSGVAAGLGAYYNIRKETLATDSLGATSPSLSEVQKTCGGVGVSIARQRLDGLLGRGAHVGEYDAAQAASLPERVFKAVAKTVEWDYEGRVVPSSWRILDVERTLPEHGYARIDLGIDDGQGPAVLDWKCKLSLKDIYRQRELDRYRNHWNMLHYTWAYGQVHGARLGRYYIGLIVLEPRFSVEIVPYPVTPEVLKAWEQSARRVWAQMNAEDTGVPLLADCARCCGRGTTEDGECDDCLGSGNVEVPADPWMAAKHADEFGNCEFYDACFTYGWDPALMAADYIKKEDA